MEAHGALGGRRPAHVAEGIELLLPPGVAQVGEHLAVEVEVVAVDERMAPVRPAARVEVGAPGERPVAVEVMVQIEPLGVAFPGRDHREIHRGALDGYPCGDVRVARAQAVPVDAVAGIRLGIDGELPVDGVLMEGRPSDEGGGRERHGAYGGKKDVERFDPASLSAFHGRLLWDVKRRGPARICVGPRSRAIYRPCSQ